MKTWFPEYDTGEYILKHIGIIKYILNRIQVEEELSKYIYIYNLMKLKKNLYNKRAHYSNEDPVHKMKKIFIYYTFENELFTSLCKDLKN